MIHLDRPLAWLDLESTGVSKVNDRIVELAVGIQRPGSASIEWKTRRLNPGVPIPPEATAVHGITDADVAECEPFLVYSKALFAMLNPCDFVGFGVRRFDADLLAAEFHRCGLYLDLRSRRLIDLLSIFHHEEPRDLSGAVRFYLGRDHDGAHAAETDARVCTEILEAQLERYGLPRDVGRLQLCLDEHSPYEGALERWFEMPDPEKPVDWVFQKGKHVGRTLGWVAQNEHGYLFWMVNKAEEMPFEVLRAVEPFYYQGGS